MLNYMIIFLSKLKYEQKTCNLDIKSLNNVLFFLALFVVWSTLSP